MPRRANPLMTTIAALGPFDRSQPHCQEGARRHV